MGLYIEESYQQRVLNQNQNPDGSAAGGGGSIYGDANGGYWLHYHKSPWRSCGISDKIKKVVIEDDVTVGTLAFAQLPNLRVVHAKKNTTLKALSFWECPALSYAFIDDDFDEDFNEGGAFANSSPRKTTYIVNGTVREICGVTFSLGASPWVAPSMPYFDLCGMYAKSFNHKLFGLDDPEDEKYRKMLIDINDYAIPVGIKSSIKNCKISRLRPADVSVKYEFKEGTENKPLMPNKEINTSKNSNFLVYGLDDVSITETMNDGEIYRTFEGQHLQVDRNAILSVKDGGYPNGQPSELLIYQDKASVVIIDDEEIKEQAGLDEEKDLSVPVFDDYGFHTTIDLTAYDDDTYRENDIETGTVEEDLDSDDNIFKIHNLNANGKTVITTAEQQDSLQKHQTNRYDTITIYADVNRNTPTYNLHFTSKATKVSVNGQSRYYINGKFSERAYGEDFIIRPKTIWSDENGDLQYAKEGEIVYDEVLVEANWGVSWKYILKTVMYSKDKHLESLSVDGLPLYPSFRKNIYEYDVYSSEDSFDGVKVNAAIDNPWSAYILYKIDRDRYEITVLNRFTRESSKYTIKLNCTTPSISKLSVNGETIELIKNKLDYEIKVDALNTNTPVTFEPAENSQVIDYGWNLTEIENGRLIYEITVKTPTHEKATYSIVLFKEMPVTNDIKHEVYTSGDRWVGYPITIKVVPEKESVMVIGNGTYTLKYRTNIYTVKLIDGDLEEDVTIEVKANYRYYTSAKMTCSTTPDGTTIVTLLDDILTAGDWHTDYFNITKKLIIYCNRYAIKAKIPENSAQIIELRDATVLPEDFTGNCHDLQEIHLYQLPWQIGAEVFSNPAKMRIRTYGEYVSKYRSFPVWNSIGEILSFDDSDDSDDSNNSDNTGGTSVQEWFEVKSFDIYLHSPEYFIMSVSPEENMTIELPSIIRQIDIRTQLEGNADISIEGPKKLKVGDNRYTITVGSSVYGLTVRSVTYSAIGKVGEADSPVEFFDVTGNVLQPGRYYQGIVITKQGHSVGKRYVNGILK